MKKLTSRVGAWQMVLLAFLLCCGSIADWDYNRVLYPDDIPILGMHADEYGNMTGEVDNGVHLKTGEAIVATLRDILKEMEKDWLSNDVAWPTCLLDNPQSYQGGMLFAVRQIVQVLAQKVTRMNPTDPPNQHLERVQSAVSIDGASWMMPAFEDELAVAITELDALLAEIRSGRVRIPDRKDTLRDLLSTLGAIIGGSVGRLANIPRIGEHRMTTVTAGDDHATGEKLLKREDAQTPWLQIDNEFYSSQGVMFVVKMVFAATLVDFGKLIDIQNSTELGRATFLIMDPYFYRTSPLVVLNGDPLSLLSNHPTALHAVLLSAWVNMEKLSIAVSGRQ